MTARIDPLDATAAGGGPGDETLPGRGGPRTREGPARIGRYVMLEALGEGAMGVVIAAYDPRLDRKVAIKLIRTPRRDDGERRLRMEREAQAMARLSHPNVVTVYEVGEHEGQVFLAMEFVAGQDLSGWLAEGPREWRAILEMFVQAGRGLAAAHRAGLVHRDFKPANVLVGADGRVRVGDFGVARAGDVEVMSATMDPAGSSSALVAPLTEVGALVGTPAYMSPEQFHGGRVEAASDQFSFCAALYEALHGRRAYAGDTVAELIHSVTHGMLIAPPADTGVPPRVDAVLRRGLATDPQARFADMDALLAELDVDPQRDRSAAPRERRRLAALLAVAVLATVAAMQLRRGPGGARGPFDAVLPIAIAFGLVVAVTLVFRRRLWPHPFHRSVLIWSMLLIGHSLVLRIVMAGLGSSYTAINQADMILNPVIAGAAGLFVARWFYWVGALPLIGGLIALAWPAGTEAISSTVFPGQGLLIVYLWTRDTARSDHGRGRSP